MIVFVLMVMFKVREFGMIMYFDFNFLIVDGLFVLVSDWFFVVWFYVEGGFGKVLVVVD